MNSQRTLPPPTLQWAAFVSSGQAAFALVYAVLLIIRDIRGVEDESIVYESSDANTAVGLGTGIFLIIIFGTVILGAFMMTRGHRWGRGPVVMLELLLVPISFYMFSGGAILPGIITLVSALVALGLLFAPASVQWAARQYNASRE